MFGRLMVERMLRAFCASALGFLAVGINGATLSSDGLRALGVGAFGAGVSACFTLISQFFGDPNSTSFTKTTVQPMEAGGK